MAEIRPLRAWRYNHQLQEEIESLTSPLFDVVSENQLRSLYQNPLNSIHLSVPGGDNSAENASNLLRDWKASGILIQDPLPGIYVYYQYFQLPGDEVLYCRKGFICNIRIHDWDDQVILRHENTMPKSVDDRTSILAATEMNVSPTHGLYTDVDRQLEPYMDECIRHPVHETEDYQGVRDVLGVIHDFEVIKIFLTLLSEKQVILADGHHRYEGSLNHFKKKKEGNPNHSGSEGYNYHLMYLTNTEAHDFRILPTHRVISGLSQFSEQGLLARLENDFIIKPVEDFHEVESIILGKPWAFGLMFSNSAYKVRLKPEAINQLPWPFPDQIKSLDITVMHYFIIERGLGVKGVDQQTSPNIQYDRSFADVVAKLIRKEIQVGIITNGVSMKDVTRVCYSGYTMPPKTTFFYPKVICGFVFGSINDNEFKLPVDFRLG